MAETTRQIGMMFGLDKFFWSQERRSPRKKVKPPAKPDSGIVLSDGDLDLIPLIFPMLLAPTVLQKG